MKPGPEATPLEESPHHGLRRWSGAPAAFHAADLPTPALGTVEVWAVTSDRPTVVAGSTQRDLLDVGLAARAGLDVARRRTGGGVVVVDPQSSVWLDVVLARGDGRVSDDVGRSFDWVGSVLAGALREAGVEVAVHRGPGRWDELGRLICFAGVGPGECLDRDGRKVLGLSQRRTRDQVRFQAMAYLEVPVALTPASIADHRLPGAGDGKPMSRQAVEAELGRRTASLGTGRTIAWWRSHLGQSLLNA
ncbi:MAG: hypothetical protein WAT32_18535 [Candidatus Microthrix parvicella]